MVNFGTGSESGKFETRLTYQRRFRRPVARPDGAGLPAMQREVGHVGDVAGDADQLVALLVDEQLALGALEALPAQAPDAVVTVRAVGALRKVENEKKHDDHQE